MVDINKNKESQIAGIVGNNRAVASGYLRLLSLDALRERMGPKWQSRADHIRFIAEGVIKRHLTKGQTYYQASDSAYVMVFDFDVEDRAEHVCRAIGREVVQRLLGASEGGPEDLSVEMRATVVPCDQLRGNANPVAAFEQCLAAAEPHLVSASDDDPGRPEPELTPVPAAESEEVRAPSSLVDRINALVHKTEQQLTAEAAGSPRGEQSSVSGGYRSGFDVAYLPFWTVGARAFLSFHLELQINAAGQNRAAVEDFMKVRDDWDVVRMIDRLALSRGLLDLRQSLKEGRKYVSIVPIHAASVLRDLDRGHLVSLLAAQPEIVRRLVSLELIDAKEHSWHELLPCIWALRSNCRHVVVRQGMPLPWLQAQHLPERTIGFSVVLSGTRRPEGEIIREFNAFVETAGKHRVETYVYGLRSRSLAFAAIGAGFSHVSGPAIASRQKAVIGVAAAAMEELFARIER